MSTTVLPATVSALREAAVRHAAASPSDGTVELDAGVEAERAKARDAAVAAAGNVMKQRPSDADVEALKGRAWVDGLTDDELASLAAVMQQHAPLNVVLQSWTRTWAAAASKVVPGLH